MKKAILILVTLLVSGCFASSRYSGDGTLIDHGMLAAADRFVLDLGSVDFSTKNRREYSLSRLPRERFTIGLKWQSARLSDAELKGMKIRLRVLLTNERNERVVDRESRLGDWVWNQTSTDTFAYLTDREPRNEKTVDGGWGTYFEPRRRGTYRLTLEVVEADPAAKNLTFRLVARGGGWK